uniref:ras association domain-containing protein 4-like n=1 Tax=Ictidomys tridecemlineatus TaxID=43179 RepID=UPI000B53C809
CVWAPQEEGALIIEGLLNIAWGLRRPIRLQMQDDRERVHLPSASWAPGQPSCPLKEPPPQDSKITAEEPSTQTVPKAESSRDGSGSLEEEEEVPQLMRTKSDASCMIQRRPKCRAPGEAQRIRRHRFSINGHFYNHKVIVPPGIFQCPEAESTGAMPKHRHCSPMILVTPPPHPKGSGGKESCPKTHWHDNSFMICAFSATYSLSFHSPSGVDFWQAQGRP